MKHPELTLRDFLDAGIPMDKIKLESSGDRHVWYYTGCNLAEYTAAGKLVMGTTDKFYDVVTRRPEGANRIDFDGHLGLLLVGCVQLYERDGQDTFVYSNRDFPRVDPDEQRGFTTNYNYLAHFGFFTKPKRGTYVLTRKAIDFYYHGTTCPDYVIVSEDKVLREGPSNTRLSDVNNVQDLKENPFWWEAYAT